MLEIQILSHIFENPEASARDMAWTLAADKKEVDHILEDLLSRGLADEDSSELLWTISAEGCYYLSERDVPSQEDNPALDVPTLKSSPTVEMTTPVQDSPQEPSQNPDLGRNLSQMFSFLEEWYKLGLTPLCDIGSDSRIRWCGLTNHAIDGLPGILVGDDTEDQLCWLSVQRLKQTPPPELHEVLIDWCSVKDNPEIEPEILESISVVDEEATEALWEEFQVRKKQIAKLPEDDPTREQELVAPEEVLIEYSLENLPDVQEAWDEYRSQWGEWSTSEIPRRKTIALYQRLFSYRQQLENGTAANPQELVWGVGMTYRSGAEGLRFPLLSIPVEFIGSAKDLTIRIGGLNRPPHVNIHALLDEFPEGAAAFEQKMHQQLSPNAEMGSLTPFDVDRLRNILDVDACNIDSNSRFTETRPTEANEVTFTLDWVVMVQTRSTNYMLQDVQNLKEIAESNENLTSALNDIAIRREDPYPESDDVFQGFSHLETDPLKAKGTSRSLYFPKPYNQEQVEVIRKLETSEGVVLQGPPGTGKTHTIANVISHYLATGKRVLVTSQKSPALKVLKSQLPDGIQILTGLLLDSDREGQAELEASVNRITTDILQLNLKSLREDIDALASAIENTRKRLLVNEKRTDDLVRRYRTVPPEHIGSESPRELAEEVAASAERHAYFQDELDPEKGWQVSEIGHDFFERLRLVRKIVGEHLKTDPRTIIDPSELPTVEHLGNLHNNLCSHSASREALDQLVSYPAKQYLQSEQRSSAIEVLEKLEHQMNALSYVYRGDWQRLLFCCYHSQDDLPEDLKGIESDLCKSVNHNVAILKGNDQEVKKYALKPVRIGSADEIPEKLLGPVSKAADGKKPFSLVEQISSRALINDFQAVTIRDAAPTSPDEWTSVKRWIELGQEARKLAQDWNFHSNSLSTPQVPLDLGIKLYAEMRPIIKQIEGIRCFNKEELFLQLTKADELLNLEDHPESLLSRCLTDSRILPSLVESLRLLIREYDEREAATERQRLVDQLGDNPTYSRHSNFYRTTLGSPDRGRFELSEEWRTLLHEADVLHSKVPELEELHKMTSFLKDAGAKTFAKLLITEPYDLDTEDETFIPPAIAETWAWAMRIAYLKHIDAKSELLKLIEERLFEEKKLAKNYEDIAVKHTWSKLKETFKEKPRVVNALNEFVGHIKKIGQGKGKLAPFHRHEAQKALKRANEAIRCWIMPQWRVSESLPAGYGMFDLVIIDEASQSDLKALPAIARGKKVLVVGDDKQVSPLQVGTTVDSVLALYHRFLSSLPYGSSMTIKNSIYDLASISYGAASIRLREHFRCAEPIINFSSRNFYDDEIKYLRVPKATERMHPVLVDVYLEGGIRSEGGKTNEAEADYILEEITRLTEDESFGDRSIGIVTLLGHDQSRYIWDKIQEGLSEETIIRHRIRCGDSSTFQGSEFDVVFLSMVDHVSKRVATSVPLAQRYNVAASRAKDRMYLCRSIPLDGLKSEDLRHKLISHFSDPGLGLAGKGREGCESPFEKEIFDFLSNKGYMVLTQVAAAGFRIDLVAEDAAGRRLAIECDGYIAHPEHKWAEDMSRQRTLERVGWTFHRIWGPSYYRDKESSKKELLKAIEVHGIEKHQDSKAIATGIVESRRIPAPEEPYEPEADRKTKKENEESFSREATENEH